MQTVKGEEQDSSILLYISSEDEDGSFKLLG